jgi:hypothetical protein
MVRRVSISRAGEALLGARQVQQQGCQVRLLWVAKQHVMSRCLQQDFPILHSTSVTIYIVRQFLHSVQVVHGR